MADTAGADLDLTLGLIFVGLIATGCLFGVTTAQFGWYFAHYRQDRQVVKILVLVVWLLDAIHLGLYFDTMYIYLVQKEGMYFSDHPLPWSSNAQLFVNACVICIIQSFYASRIWQLSRRRLLLAIMAVLISMTWFFAMVLFVKTVITNTVAEFVLLTPYDIAMSVMSAATDTFLSGALMVLLWTFRKDTQGADRLINKLLLFAVNTGLLTGVCAVMAVITVLTKPSTNLFVLFYYIGTRLYTVSLLAMLNARIDLRIQAERMGERPLPEIEVTVPQRLTNKKSSQATALRRTDVPDVVVTMPCHDSDCTGTATTTGESSSSAPIPAPPRVHYFIITKKRKRSQLQAVDPCLGFYPTSSSSPRVTSHSSPQRLCLGPQPIVIPFAEQVAHTSRLSFMSGALEHSGSTDNICRPALYRTQGTAEVDTLARAPHHEREVEAALTVERFLRSAATTKATKHYSNWRRRRSPMKKRESPPRKQVEWTSDDEEYVTEEPPKKRQRRKKTRPLSARILAAAVVTGVDAVGGLFFPDPPKAQTSTRRPLPLSLGGRAPSPVDLMKSRRRRFVDPQKVDRADSQFVRVVTDTAAKKVEQVKEQRPITAWEPESLAVLGPSLGHDYYGPQEYFATRPLTLVPSTHPRSALRARCTTIISRSCPIPKRRKNEAWRSDCGDPRKFSRVKSIPNLSTAPSPCASSVVRRHGLSPSHKITEGSRDPSVIDDHTHITLCPSANVPPAPVAIPSSSPGPPSHSTVDSNLDEVWASRGSQRPKPTERLDLLIALSPQSAPRKPLKSLVSLLNDLREIACNATQVAATSQARQSRPATSSSVENWRNDPVRSASPSRPVRSRLPSAQSSPPAVVARPATSGARMGVAPAQEGYSLEGGGDHGGFGNGADSHPDTHRVDVLAILQLNQRKAILLPSSPLPGWNALPSSTAYVRDESDAEDNDDDH
ncbi:hypothetical protein GSI_02385 [Ganoderma sinense ZZ0214-1]|uniref:DUF6534 domain-containing protein n=1 Tax=Ganoderma sinense ZZ0214-1 TaxID=1077348 RepID=A0A2G8SPG7_9APHY|nr:hypothetical protein GSI_02385 [Ganoderma sinense ZZ0214-1]